MHDNHRHSIRNSGAAVRKSSEQEATNTGHTELAELTSASADSLVRLARSRPAAITNEGNRRELYL